jgi:hypothetical protein
MSDVLIHKVTDGPYSSHDAGITDPEEDMEFFFIEVLLECEGILFTKTLGHPDFDYIYDIVKHFKQPTIEPYVLTAYKDPENLTDD